MGGTTTVSTEEGGLLSCHGGHTEKEDNTRISSGEVAPTLIAGSVPEVQLGRLGEDGIPPPSNVDDHQIHAGQSEHANFEPSIVSSQVRYSALHGTYIGREYYV